MNNDDAAFSTGLVCFLIAGYFVAAFAPGIIAMLRGHHNTAPIFLVCFFFGWTCIGWIIGFIWAFSHIPEDRGGRRNYGNDYDDEDDDRPRRRRRRSSRDDDDD